MKSRKIIFVLAALLMSLHFCFGQEKSEAFLVDEFPTVACDDFLARIENFLIELQNNPDSQGYAVVSGSSEETRRKAGYELIIKGAVALRNFDKNRIISVRGKAAKDLQVQFWSVPPGAKKPDFKETEWDFVFPPQTKAFKFRDDNTNDDICPPTPFETIYAEYLNANPRARGHIVIYAKSLKKYNELKMAAKNLLKDVPTSRLRFFHVRQERSENYANVEYWIVPRKKR